MAQKVQEIISVFSLFQEYKSKTDEAKKEYLQKLAAYRASLVTQVGSRYLVVSQVYFKVPRPLRIHVG